MAGSAEVDHAYYTLFLAGEVDSGDTSAVESWCTLLKGLCEAMHRSGQATWDRTFVDERSSILGLGSQVADAVHANLSGLDPSALGDAVSRVVRDLGETDGDVTTVKVDLLRDAYHEVVRAIVDTYAQRAEDHVSPAQPEDRMAQYKDGHYHVFEDDLSRVWVEGAQEFLTPEELVGWNAQAATERLVEAWAAVEERLGPAVMRQLTPEQQARVTQEFIARVAGAQDVQRQAARS